MKNWISCEIFAPRLSHQSVGAMLSNPSSRRRDFNQINSATVSAMALYLDSVEDQETLICLRVDHEIRFEPK
ncbi:hypothetical protein HanHA300_Chr07g0236171 [Helianthus annuus]|nr:hypothetical protein HanHA300_Chr07g0236171 [Helianthus annuus]KAJ0562598.1 hypothetical protein HanHA89_Chr07g0253351 [Helianthus annuus]KAJ0727973.1 hypothetical protein HanLR1_Chr07g0236111 [Helianthus annuus]KAJ0730755.1 hypothetical protein HanOQP8_Chr07g0243901 [Helianthus annuus]